MKTFLRTGLALALVISGTSLRAQEQQLVDRLQAIVTDTPITQQKVERLTTSDEEMLYRQYRTQPELLRKLVIKHRQDAVDILVTREVILQDFKESIKVPESILDEIVQDRLKAEWPDNIALTKQLELEGITLEQLKQEIRVKFVVEQMRLKYVPEPIISPRKIEDYYVAHRNDFKLEDQIKMRMIVLNKSSPDTVDSTRQRANEILSQIKSGASFEDLARSYSEGSLRQEGGETGWEDLSVVNRSLVEALNKLKPGEHSDIIETADGFYLLLLEDRHTAHFRPLSEVRGQIERNLSAEETERLSKQWIDRLKRKTFVKYF